MRRQRKRMEEERALLMAKSCERVWTRDRILRLKRTKQDTEAERKSKGLSPRDCTHTLRQRSGRRDEGEIEVLV